MQVSAFAVPLRSYALISSKVNTKALATSE